MTDRTSRGAARSGTAATRSAGRLTGVDIARFLAIFWMFVAHIGPDRDDGWPNRLLWLGDGREAALFAFLAGVSLTLVHGERLRLPWRDPEAAATSRAVVRRTVEKSFLLLLLGLWLAGLETGVLVILPFFALYFVVALPALYLPTRTIAVTAAYWAFAGPMVSFILRYSWERVDPGYRVPDFGALADPGEFVTTLFVTGTYPVITWMPFVFAGMAVGRLDLRSVPVLWRLTGAGTALALLGYGGSWLIVEAGGAGTQLQTATDRLFDAPPGSVSVLEALGWYTGTTPPNDPTWLVVAQGHSGTPFEVVGATGVACAVLGLCCLACMRFLDGDRRPAPWYVAAPAAVGAMSLSVYTVHLIAGWSSLTPGAGSWVRLLAYTAVALAGAWLWARLLGKGPLERALAVAGGRSPDVRSPGRPAGPDPNAAAPPDTDAGTDTDTDTDGDTGTGRS
ncbi:heparan-alpha-glucosaminide N-acetyltransferase domain-containing protein [Streptodolium elevatio]|uniref:Heparan-alpha-glucosaminide N-acetyltransferase domain-containing protein n=1 Tax=Streptodolium elevatio TaxID=3157996 RepID=A0ABV3DMG7_9ACTN